MKLQVRIAGSAVAALALFLSACGGDDGGTTPPPAEPTVTGAPTETTDPGGETTEPGDETTEPGGEDPAPPAGDFPFEEGPVDVDEFNSMLQGAMEGVEHLLLTTEGIEGMESTTFVDMADPDNVRAYGTAEMEGSVIETVVQDGQLWTRTDEGEWQQVGEVPEGEDDLANLDVQYESVELIDQAARQFSVEIPVEEATQTALLTVDEQFRASSMEMEVMGQTMINTYDYETTLDIPEVG